MLPRAAAGLLPASEGWLQEGKQPAIPSGICRPYSSLLCSSKAPEAEAESPLRPLAASLALAVMQPGPHIILKGSKKEIKKKNIYILALLVRSHLEALLKAVGVQRLSEACDT